MEDSVVDTVVKKSLFSNLPKWLKIFLVVLSIITMVYWIGYIVIKILALVRFILEQVSKKEHWWFFVIVILLVGIVALLLAQFVYDLNPFGNFFDWCEEIFDKARNAIGEWILG